MPPRQVQLSATKTCFLFLKIISNQKSATDCRNTAFFLTPKTKVRICLTFPHPLAICFVFCFAVSMYLRFVIDGSLTASSNLKSFIKKQIFGKKTRRNLLIFSHYISFPHTRTEQYISTLMSLSQCTYKHLFTGTERYVCIRNNSTRK